MHTSAEIKTYLHLEGFHNLHVLLKLFPQLVERFRPLLRLCVSVLNGLAKFLQNRTKPFQRVAKRNQVC